VKTIVKDFKVPDIDTDTGDAIKRPATPADRFVSPFPNEYAARASNGGALPPDLSLIINARENGARYVFSILRGYMAPPPGLKVPAGRFYNGYMQGDLTSAMAPGMKPPEGGFIAMPLQLTDNRVTYDDGTKATADQDPGIGGDDLPLDLHRRTLLQLPDDLAQHQALRTFLLPFRGEGTIPAPKAWEDEGARAGGGQVPE